MKVLGNIVNDRLLSRASTRFEGLLKYTEVCPTKSFHYIMNDESESI